MGFASACPVWVAGGSQIFCSEKALGCVSWRRWIVPPAKYVMWLMREVECRMGSVDELILLMVQGMSLHEAGRELGLSDRKIARWDKKYGLSRLKFREGRRVREVSDV